jgi:NAD(P)-dependent dehydrogenase (short-subunit alcohol dehydrogenase family)
MIRPVVLDLKGTGIRVNVLSPGATATPGLLDGLAKTGNGDAIIIVATAVLVLVGFEAFPG